MLLLEYLFHVCPWKHAFTFKGGTSLSKAYDLIHRFSEDIDLILDWRVLGYAEKEPWQFRSKTKQEQFNKEANQRAEKFLENIVLPTLKKDLSEYFNIEQMYILMQKTLKQSILDTLSCFLIHQYCRWFV